MPALIDKDLEQERDKVKKIIKAVIISRKGGMPTQDLRDTYKKLTGDDIPVFNIGYSSLFHLMRDIPEIYNSKNDSGEHVLLVKSKKAEHIQAMISKQKTSSKSKYHQSSRRNKREEAYDKARFCHSSPNNSKNADLTWTQDILREKILVPKIKISHIENTREFHPILKERQLIGDDFFLQLAIRYLDFPLVRKSETSAIRCGTVESGQSLKKFLYKVNHMKNMSNKLMICLGAEDVYQRRKVEDMCKDLDKILNVLQQKLGYNANQITICTIPPLANVPVGDQRLYNLYAFNSYIRNLEGKYEIIDMFENFTTDSLSIDFNLFQMSPRNVSGTRSFYVLWNYEGRRLAVKLLS